MSVAFFAQSVYHKEATDRNFVFPRYHENYIRIPFEHYLIFMRSRTLLPLIYGA